MKNRVRAGVTGSRGGKGAAASLLPAASLLVLFASLAMADGVDVNWEALGEPAPSSERVILRHPGEKETLPVIRLKPPADLEDTAPTPLAKPAVIPESTAETPAPAASTPSLAAQSPAKPAAKKPETPATAAAVPQQRPAQPAPVETVEAPAKQEPETPATQPQVAKPAPAPETAPETDETTVTGTAAPATATPAPEPAEPATAEAAPEKAPAATRAANNGQDEQQDGQKAAEEQKVAALSPPEPAFARVLFDEGSSTILSTARAELDAAAERLKQNDERVQLKAYGGDPGELSSDVRKLSLRRALAVYNYLRDQGILTNRMDVRAFGGTRDTGPTERVDIVLQER